MKHILMFQTLKREAASLALTRANLDTYMGSVSNPQAGSGLFSRSLGVAIPALQSTFQTLKREAASLAGNCPRHSGEQ